MSSKIGVQETGDGFSTMIPHLKVVTGLEYPQTLNSELNRVSKSYHLDLHLPVNNNLENLSSTPCLLRGVQHLASSSFTPPTRDLLVASHPHHSCLHLPRQSLQDLNADTVNKHLRNALAGWRWKDNTGTGNERRPQILLMYGLTSTCVNKYNSRVRASALQQVATGPHNLLP